MRNCTQHTLGSVWQETHIGWKYQFLKSYTRMAAHLDGDSLLIPGGTVDARAVAAGRRHAQRYVTHTTGVRR